MLKLNRADQAKTCFMEALALDVKCADAFSQLVNAEMLTPDEGKLLVVDYRPSHLLTLCSEWDFIQGLSYSTQTPDDAEFVQLIYTSRLRKDKHRVEHALTRTRLVDDFGLGDNPDVLFSFADALYTDFRWAECYAMTSRIMGLTAMHVPTIPLHIACMYHLNHLHSKLFLLAHEMVDREPENALSWYAVGVWYLSSGKWGQARSYLRYETYLSDLRMGPNIFQQQNYFDGPPFRTCLGCFRSYFRYGGRARPCRDRVFDLCKNFRRITFAPAFHWNGTDHAVELPTGRRGTRRRFCALRKRSAAL